MSGVVPALRVAIMSKSYVRLTGGRSGAGRDGDLERPLGVALDHDPRPERDAVLTFVSCLWSANVPYPVRQLDVSCLARDFSVSRPEIVDVRRSQRKDAGRRPYGGN